MTTTFGNTRGAPSVGAGTQSHTTAGFPGPFTSVDSNQQQRVMVQGGGSQNYTEMPGSLALQFDRSHLNMLTSPGTEAFDKVVVMNVGSTTVHYEWRKVRRPDFIEASHTDQLRRFYCYNPPGTLKPGESRTFTFTFRSEKVGVFFEEWELVPDPHFTLNPLPLLCLSGTAKVEDELVEDRALLEKQFRQKSKIHAVGQAMEDMIAEVHTQDTETHDARNSAHFRRLFEANNAIAGYYWSQYLQERLPDLVEQILHTLAQEEPESISGFVWNGSITQLEALLGRITNEFDRWLLTLKLRQYKAYARSKPLDSATSYGLFTGLLGELVEKVSGIVTKAREETGLWEYTFEAPPDQGYTPEELQAREEALKSKKNLFYKSKKMKPRSEEEEEKDLAEAREKVKQKLGQELLKMVDGIQGKTAADQAIAQLEDRSVRNALTMSVSQWSALSRKQGIMDVDFEGKNVLLRMDLDVELEPIQHPSIPPESKIAGQASGPSSTYQMQSVGFTSKAQITLAGGDMETNRSVMQESIPTQGGADLPRAISQPQGLIRPRQVADPHSLSKIVQTVKYCMDRMANRVFLIGNLGPRSGQFNHEFSMKPIHSVLAKQIEQSVVYHEGSCYVQHFSQKLQNDELPENTVFVMENLNFAKEEFGFTNVQEIVEESPVIPELDSKQEISGEAQKEEEQEEPQPTAPKRRIKTYYATEDEIALFASNLSQMADVYVNDAPLSNTNLLRTHSLTNIQSPRKVIGLHMTEAVRKLCYFFMYPALKPMVAILGGNDLMGKLAMINGLLDYNTPDVKREVVNYLKEIFLLGRVGLEVLEIVLLKIHEKQNKKQKLYPTGSLGWTIRHEEMSAREAVVLNVLAKARRTGVKITLPCDFQIVARPDNWEDLVAGKEEETLQSREVSREETKHNQTTEEAVAPRSRKNTTMFEEGFTSKRTEESKAKEQQPPPPPPVKRKRRLLEWLDTEFTTKCEVSLPRRLQDPISLLNSLEEEEIAPPVEVKEVEIEKAPPVPSKGNKSSTKQEPVAPEVEATTPMPDDKGPEEDEEEGRLLNPDDVVVEYGSATIAAVRESILSAGKILWDGSLACYGGTDTAGDSNKALCECLQVVRETNSDYENIRARQVILLHDSDALDEENSTMAAFKDGAERLRQEQISMRNTRTSSAMGDGDSGYGMEETSFEDQGGSSLLSKDLQAFSDVAVVEADVTPFTGKLISGRMIPGLMDVEEHGALSKEEIEEDLSCLEDI